MSNDSNNSNIGQKAKSQEEDELAEEGTSYLQEMNKLKKTSTKLPELPIVIKPIKNNGFDLKEEIGKGQFSTVYRATWTQKPDVDIACKRIKLEDVDEDWKANCLDSELAIITALKHKNIVNVIKVFKFKRLVYVFMDLAKNGSIKEFMDRHKHPVKESQAKVWFNDIMAGISYAHSKGVAHRDLKLENILLDDNYSALLSDFGFAVMDITSHKLMRTTCCGTPDYMAPEVLETKLNGGKPYDAKKADLYSMGVCLYEMINYDKPIECSNKTISELIGDKKRGTYRLHSKINDIVSNDLKDLINRLMEPDPQKRITIKQVSKHRSLKTSK